MIAFHYINHFLEKCGQSSNNKKAQQFENVHKKKEALNSFAFTYG